MKKANCALYFVYLFGIPWYCGVIYFLGVLFFIWRREISLRSLLSGIFTVIRDIQLNLLACVCYVDVVYVFISTLERSTSFSL